MLPDQNSDLYYSYLLRVWRLNSQPQRWQVSLRDARTGESHQFADLQQLKTFLDQRMSGVNPGDGLTGETNLFDQTDLGEGEN
jgi:hypothetical protein